MPAIQSREMGVALDMHGCPNRCRHCWLGNASKGHMTEDDLRWAAAQFRSYVKEGETKPFIEKLEVNSAFREPDFSDDYERLHELASELGDVPPTRHELLSVWRLARDPKYAEWARRIGPDTCQISFFGMGETNDWFYRRKGAFDDCIRATERLLEIGMKPRWQLFLTKRIIPELGDLLKIRDRFGGEFPIFMHPPGPEGEGRKIYHLSAMLEDTKLIPAEIVEASKAHLNKENLWTTEAEQYDLRMSKEFGPMDGMTGKRWFFVQPNYDVYSNIGTLEPWWRLGNLRTDPIGLIFDNFENDRPLGYRINRDVPQKKLALRFGNPDSQAVVNGVEGKWLAEWCEDAWKTTKRS